MNFSIATRGRILEIQRGDKSIMNRDDNRKLDRVIAINDLLRNGRDDHFRPLDKDYCGKLRSEGRKLLAELFPELLRKEAR